MSTLSANAVSTATTVIISVSDLKDWRRINNLSNCLTKWCLIIDRGYTQLSVQDFNNDFKLSCAPVSDDNQIVPMIESLRNCLVNEEKVLIDQTYMQKDLELAIKTFNSIYFNYQTWDTGTKCEVTNVVVVEHQRTLARNLLEKNFTSPAWGKDDVIAIFASHGEIRLDEEQNQKLYLYLETLNAENEVVSQYFPVEKYWKCWYEYVKDVNELEREKPLENQLIKSRTLVMVLDVCHSGKAVDELKIWCDENKDELKDNNVSITLFASCAECELSRGEYYLKVWLESYKSLQDRSLTISGTTNVDDDVIPDCILQNPKFYTFPDEKNSVYAALNFTARGLYQKWLGFQNIDSVPVSIDVCWRKIKGEIEKDMMESGEYEVLDVRCFVSNLGPQIAAVIQSKNAGEKSIRVQHVHMDTTGLLHNDWKVDTNHGSTKISAKITHATEGFTLLSAAGPQHVLNNLDLNFNQRKQFEYTEQSSKNTDSQTFYMESKPAHEDEIDVSKDQEFYNGVLVSTNTILIEEDQRLGPLPKNLPVPVYTGFIEKVEKFLGIHEKNVVYISQVGKMQVREWKEKLGKITEENELKKYWHFASSVKGLARTRFRNHDESQVEANEADSLP